MPRELSASDVQALTHPGRYKVAKNLYLQVRGNSRSWLFRYQAGRAGHWLGLGSLALISVAEAKRRALELRAGLLNGRDPLAEKRAARPSTAMTFAEAAERFIAANEASWRNAKHVYQWRATIAAHAVPIIGHMQPADIDRGHIAAVLKPIWSKKPETAKRLRGRLERILDWCSAHGLRTGPNPAGLKVIQHLLPANVQTIEHHPAVPWAELPKVLKAVRGEESIASKALVFTALTAARSNEVMLADWSEVDLEKRLWIVPAERTKAGRPFRIPLSEPALALLHSLPRRSGLLFPGRTGKPLSNMTMLKLLRRWAPGKSVHGLRSSFRDWCADTGVPPEVAEAALAHAKKTKVIAAYFRSDLLSARLPLMERWAEHCMGRKSGEVRRLTLAMSARK